MIKDKKIVLNRTIVVSASLILFCALCLGILYKTISTQLNKTNLTQKLHEEVNQKAILMEGYLKPEIVLGEKLASSPTVIDFFKNPSDKENRKRAIKEFESFKNSFSSHMIFWANDKDKEFWNNMEYSYTIDPNNSDDYWYKMTLYDTAVYNFNINYNAELDKTCLWLNAVVRDEKLVPIGMAGTGIELDNFIGKCYETLNPAFSMYFFNTNKEITGAKDKNVLVDKVHIDTFYNQYSDFESLMATSKEYVNNGDGLYNFIPNKKEIGVIRYLPSYDWYLIATVPIKAGNKNTIASLSILLFIVQVIFTVFVIFIAKLRTMMNKARIASQSLSAETHNLAVSSKENAATAQDQSAAVKEIVATMEDNTALSENISQKIKDVSSVAAKTNEDVREGVHYIKENVKQLQEIASTNMKTIAGIRELGDKIENIWDIVTLINSVADQAKIIAFNAELEASSAGESGKNFHIVATEIRRLADGIIDGTKEIKDKINEIQESSDSLILESENGTEKIQSGVENAKGLEDRFSSIKNASEITAQSADKITTIIQQQAIASEQILVTLRQISSGVENFTSATENISQASQNLKVIADELTNGKLSDLNYDN